MKSVAVFCGSSLGADPAFVRAAEDLGRLLAERGAALIYGGGDIGLMGRLARSAAGAGGEVLGVIPGFLRTKEVGHVEGTQLRVVESMHERKAVMAEMADAFIALPGGFGTLEEFFEILTWGQLGLHNKPLGLLNASGFYGHLLAFLDHAVEQGLLKAKHRARVLESPDAGTLLEKLAAWKPPGKTKKWIDRPSET